MRPLQLCLWSQWDFLNDRARISWNPVCKQDLHWWYRVMQEEGGVDLSLPVPDLSFYSDASDIGWGALVGEYQMSRALDLKPTGALHQFERDDRRAEGASRVPLLPGREDCGSLLRQYHDSGLSSEIGRHEISDPVRQVQGDPPMGRIPQDYSSPPIHQGDSQHNSRSPQSPQPGDRFRMGSPPGSCSGTSSSMASNHRPFCDVPHCEAPSVLRSVDRPQGSGSRCPSPTLGRSSSVCLPSNSHHREGSTQTEGVSELRSNTDRPLLASKRLVSRSSGTSVRRSNRTTQTSGSSTSTAFSSISRKSPYASSDCVATLKRFARQAGFSSTVAGQLALCRRTSTRLNYQA